VLALLLKTPDLTALALALGERYGETPGLFEHEPLCVDLSALSAQDSLDFVALIAVLRGHGFNPMAVRGGSPEQHEAALLAGLAEAPVRVAPSDPLVTLTQTVPVEASEPALAQAVEPVTDAPTDEPVVSPEAAPVPLPATTLIIDKPLRSGQRAYARGGDLIVLAAVNFGAEVIADGSIHVYGPLRGRALAGAQGNAEARIFAACMEPQLVSIAGTWRTTEAGLAPEVNGKAAQVRLDGDKLLFEALKF
jgi:septum site-determining protein MinC